MWAGVGDGFYSRTAGQPGIQSALASTGWQLCCSTGCHSRQTTTLFATAAGGLYKSTDGGDTWEEFDNGLGANPARRIAISPFNADEAYAATMVKGVLHTFDGGRAGKAWQYQLADMMRRLLDPFIDGKVYFGYGYVHMESYQPCVFPATTAAPSPSMRSLCRLNIRGNRPVWGQLRLILKPQAAVGGRLCGLARADLCPAPTAAPGSSRRPPQASNASPPGIRSARSERGLRRIRRFRRAAQHRPGSHLDTPGAPVGRDASFGIGDRSVHSQSIYTAAFGGNGSDVGVFATHDGGDTWVKMTGCDYPIWEPVC